MIQIFSFHNANFKLRYSFTSCIFLFLTLSQILYAEQAEHKNSLNFTSIGNTSLPPEAFGYYYQLRKWANFQKMKLHKDSRLGGISDGICRMIPSEGLEFFLEVPHNMKKKIFLYLDLTTYEAKEDSKFPTRSLSILISGKQKKVVYFQPGAIAENPVEISLEPSDIQHNRINIKLIPDHTEGGKFWGIWDAFYSTKKELP